MGHQRSTLIFPIFCLDNGVHLRALQYFCGVFSDNCRIVGRGDWSLEELFGAIPDLRQDFENCYSTARYFTIPVNVAKRTFTFRTVPLTQSEVTFESISYDKVGRFTDPIQEITQVCGYNQAYLVPQYQGRESDIILYRKYRAAEIGLYSIYGQKYLEIPHIKSGHSISPNQIVIFYMFLFALGYVSRYHSELWNPFITRDITGERLLVEKALSIAERYVPNLVLNAIERAQIEFVYPSGR